MTGVFVMNTGHGVPINDKTKALRAEIGLPEVPPTVHAYPEALEEIQKICQACEFDKLIGFNIGSAVVTKRWAPEKFAQVADTLAAKGYKPVFFGGTMDEEMVQEAVALMKTTPVVATGAFTIGALAAAMRRCSLIITNDSGPMHVAISQKVPIVAMYGPSSPKLYGPYTKDATIVTAVPPCMGCASGMKHKCNDMQCMTRLTVEQVVEAAEKMLVSRGGEA